MTIIHARERSKGLATGPATCRMGVICCPMPLRLIRSDTNAALWTACSESFLDAVGGLSGPSGYPDFLLLTHRVQRDVLLEELLLQSDRVRRDDNTLTRLRRSADRRDQA